MKNTLDFRIGSRYAIHGEGISEPFRGVIANAELIWGALSDQEIAKYNDAPLPPQITPPTAPPIIFPNYTNGGAVGVAHNRRLLASDNIFNRIIVYYLFDCENILHFTLLSHQLYPQIWGLFSLGAEILTMKTSVGSRYTPIIEFHSTDWAYIVLHLSFPFLLSHILT